MSQVPSWLRCENCLWYAFANEIVYYRSTDLEKQEMVGCLHPEAAPQLHSCVYRCPRWICRRCLMSLETIVMNSPNIENHNRCARVGRGKKNNNNCGFLTVGDENVGTIIGYE
jgi:hypothetical protein